MMQQDAFKRLKGFLAKPETLGYFSLDNRTQVIADAGPCGLGAALVQITRKEPCVLRYASRLLSPVERRYSQKEKEPLLLCGPVKSSTCTCMALNLT